MAFEHDYTSKQAVNDIEGVIAQARAFSSQYNRSVIKNMTMEQYCIGHGDHDNFCYKIERELERMGNITGMSRQKKFGVWYDKKLGKYQNTKKFGNSPEDAWVNVKDEILKLLEAGEKRNYAVIENSSLSPLFRYKLLAIYYPDIYISIYSDKHLRWFCGQLGIRCESSEKAYELQRKLIQYKEQHEETRDISLVMYVKWLYGEHDAPPKTEWAGSNVNAHKELEKQLREMEKEIENHAKKRPDGSDSRLVEEWKIARSDLVSAYVKKRAGGICQLCGMPAPFNNKKDEPYLECHHVIWMSRGGDDKPGNAVALCPNCHTKMHILDLEDDVAYLRKQATKK